MCSFFSGEKKAVLSLFHTFSLLFLCSALFLSFLVVHIRERERDGERESLFFRRLEKEEEESSGALSLSLSLCFSLSCCDAYRSDRR